MPLNLMEWVEKGQFNMKNEQRLFITAITCAGLIVGSYATTNPKVAKADKEFDNASFSLAKGSGDVGDYYNITESSIVANNNIQRANFAVRNDINAIGDYTVTIKGRGETNWPVSKGIHIGLVPWYIDDLNYLVVYMEWSPTERPSGMRVVQFTGQINGKDPYVYKNGSFTSSLWNDAWMDGGNSSNAIAPSSEWTFSVQKKRSIADDADELFAYINGNQVGFFSFRDLKTYEAKKAKVGLYAWNEQTTFTSLEVSSLSNPKSFANLEEGKIAKSASSSWNASALGYAINENSNSAIEETVILSQNKFAEGNYQVKAGFPAASLKNNSKIGVIAWYQDAFNYALAYVEKKDSGCIAHIEGMSADVTKPGNIIPNKFEQTAEATIKGEDVVISAKRMSSSIVLLLNEETVLSLKNTVFATKGLCGLCVSSIDVTCTFAISSCDYVPFDWHSTTLGGESFLASAAKEGEISRSGSSFVISEEAVTANLSEWAGLVKSSNKWEDIDVSATFFNYEKNYVIGIYPFFINEENYIASALTKEGILIRKVLKGAKTEQTINYPEGFEPNGPLSLMSVLKNKKLTIKAGNTEIVKDFALTDLPYDLSPYAGFFVGGKGNTISSFSISGFSNDGIIEGRDDWSFRGPRPSTWSFNEDMTILNGRYDGGTTWLHTSALKEQEIKSFHMGAEMTLTDKTGSEYKTGLVPYYKDDSNYVIVWISMWALSTPKINVTARVNGAVIGGNEFNEVDAGVDYLGSTIKFEAELDEDMIRVYLNAAATPSYAAEFKGLSKRNLTGAKVGFNIFNTSAKFANIVLNSRSRIFVFKEKPVISEIGTRPTSGVVGSNVKLPMYTATNSRFDPIDATIAVKDPNGKSIEIIKNGFIPTIAGEYSVVITAIDDYGNEAEKIQYSIVIKEQQISDNTSEDSSDHGNIPSSNKGGFTWIIWVGISIAVLAFLGVPAILFFRKRK